MADFLEEVGLVAEAIVVLVDLVVEALVVAVQVAIGK
jgi:hypothetical protein